MMDRATISIITATYNAAAHLPVLVESLRNQTDRDFEWIVADGGSTDGTLDLLSNIDDLRVVVLSRRDFGIYDALNHAIERMSGEYYLVLGVDDRLFPDAIAQYRNAAAASRADLITAEVSAGGTILKVREGLAWRYGINGFVSAHSVGTLIRKSLHDRFGLYSRKFPIAADQLFIMQACAGGASRHVCSFEAGEFGVGGVSSEDAAGVATEFFRVQLLLGANRPVQIALLMARLLVHYAKL